MSLQCDNLSGELQDQWSSSRLSGERSLPLGYLFYLLNHLFGALVGNTIVFLTLMYTQYKKQSFDFYFFRVSIICFQGLSDSRDLPFI